MKTFWTQAGAEHQLLQTYVKPKRNEATFFFFYPFGKLLKLLDGVALVQTGLLLTPAESACDSH